MSKLIQDFYIPGLASIYTEIDYLGQEEWSVADVRNEWAGVDFASHFQDHADHPLVQSQMEDLGFGPAYREALAAVYNDLGYLDREDWTAQAILEEFPDTNYVQHYAKHMGHPLLQETLDNGDPDQPQLSIESHRTFPFSPDEPDEDGYAVLAVKVAETAGKEAENPELQLELNGQDVDPALPFEPQLPESLEDESTDAWFLYMLQPGSHQGHIAFDAENADPVQEEVDFSVPEPYEPAANIYLIAPVYPDDPEGIFVGCSFENFEHDTLYLDVYDDQGNSISLELGTLEAEEEDEQGYYEDHGVPLIPLEDEIGLGDEITAAAYETEDDARSQDNALDEFSIVVGEHSFWGTEVVDEDPDVGTQEMHEALGLLGIENDFSDAPEKSIFADV